jgi:hypothetical protein
MSAGALGAVALSLLLACLGWCVARRWVDRQLARRESGLPLAWFRIAYAAVLFLEVTQLAGLEPLWSGALPRASASDASLGTALVAWRVAIVCLGLGLFTRSSALVSYVMTLATFSTFHRFEYHADYIFTTVNLLLVFLPVSSRLSLDRVLTTRGRERAGAAPGPPQTVGEIHAALLIVFGVGVVYLDSVFYKLVSPMWRGGLGVWLPASLPHVAWHDLGPILDREWLVKGLGWLTLGFELLFLALMWWRPLRPLLLAVGLGLHLGITLVFPIPWFGLAASTVYLLLVPARWYERAGAWLARAASRAPTLRTSAQRLRGGLDALLGVSAPGSTAHAVDPPRVVLVALATFLLVSQGLATLQAPLVREIAGPAQLGAVLRRMQPLAVGWTEKVSRPLAGITRHGVFMDRHFQRYEEVIAVASVAPDGRETLLPYWEPSGAPASANNGRLWVFWNWRVVGVAPDRSSVADGIRSLTAFWAHEHGLPLDGARFVVRSKRIDVPTAWAPGWLRRERARPWREMGRARWSGASFEIEFADPDGPRPLARLEARGGLR